jgi:hypothetical protein
LDGVISGAGHALVVVRCRRRNPRDVRTVTQYVVGGDWRCHEIGTVYDLARKLRVGIGADDVDAAYRAQVALCPRRPWPPPSARRYFRGFHPLLNATIMRSATAS